MGKRSSVVSRGLCIVFLLLVVLFVQPFEVSAQTNQDSSVPTPPPDGSMDKPSPPPKRTATPEDRSKPLVVDISAARVNKKIKTDSVTIQPQRKPDRVALPVQPKGKVQAKKVKPGAGKVKALHGPGKQTLPKPSEQQQGGTAK